MRGDRSLVNEIVPTVQGADGSVASDISARHLVTFTDQKGCDYKIEGEIVASMPWSSWHNSVCHLCMTCWKMEDLVGYGDTQEVQWGDFVHPMRGDQNPPPSVRG
jgi:hypothetical protein